MTGPLVQVEALDVSFGETKALRGVSITIRRGEVFALVGGSGSGKSTLARAILRLLRGRPDSGRVLFDGHDVYGLSRPELLAFRRRCQIVFQDPEASLNPRMRVGVALEEALRLHRPDGGPTVADLLEMVGLEASHARKYPHEFSGGQRQRISIARALAAGPEFLVLDEPLSALDVSVQAQIVLLLRDLRRDHDLTYLFVSHDLAVVHNVADRVGVMDAGRVVEEGPPTDVFGSPREPYTRRLIDSIPRVLRGP